MLSTLTSRALAFYVVGASSRRERKREDHVSVFPRQRFRPLEEHELLGEEHGAPELPRNRLRCDVFFNMVVDQGTKPVEELQLLVEKHKSYITNLDKVFTCLHI